MNAIPQPSSCVGILSFMFKGLVFGILISTTSYISRNETNFWEVSATSPCTPFLILALQFRVCFTHCYVHSELFPLNNPPSCRFSTSDQRVREPLKTGPHVEESDPRCRHRSYIGAQGGLCSPLCSPLHRTFTLGGGIWKENFKEA